MLEWNSSVPASAAESARQQWSHDPNQTRGNVSESLKSFPRLLLKFFSCRDVRTWINVCVNIWATNTVHLKYFTATLIYVERTPSLVQLVNMLGASRPATTDSLHQLLNSHALNISKPDLSEGQKKTTWRDLLCLSSGSVCSSVGFISGNSSQIRF